MNGVLDRRLAAISSVVILGAIMSILDTTIVNVAIDALAREFNASLSTIQWVSTGYMLALATVIPLTGWGADRFGTKRLFMLSVGLFLIGSALCGLSWSAESLIVFRVIQGLGGGMIMPVGMTILTQAAGPQRVGRVMSVIGVPMLLAPVVGPVLGGWLVDDVSWRWIFYVNVPVGIVALILAWRILETDRPQAHHKLDLLGLLLLSPGLAALVYGLAEMASNGGLGSASVLGSLGAGIVLITLFVFHALRTTEPLLDLRLFKSRGFSAGAATFFLLGGALFGAMILIPLYYQVVRGESALAAGLLMAPQGLGAAVAMPLSGRFTDRRGAGKVVIAGIIVLLIATIPFTQVSTTTPYWLLAGTLFVRGIGLGMTMMPAMSAAYQTLERSAVPRATTTLNILNRVGGSIGTALLAVVLQHQITSSLPAGGAVSGIGAATELPAALQARIAPLLADAFGTTFWWAFALAAIGLVPALLLPRRAPTPPDGLSARELEEEAREEAIAELV
jgi:EmrB/QacA subfamily drug resistance transporter